MRAGELDRSITIQARTETGQDAAGQPVYTWAKIHTADTIAAGIEPMGGAENFTGQQTIAKQRITFRIRWRSGITTLNRVLFDGLVWDVLNTRPMGRRETLLIDAEARADGAA